MLKKIHIRHNQKGSLQSFPVPNQPLQTFGLPPATLQHNNCTSSSFPSTLNFLMAVVNTLNSSKEISEFSFKNANVKSILSLQTEDEKQTVTFFFRMCQKEAL